MNDGSPWQTVERRRKPRRSDRGDGLSEVHDTSKVSGREQLRDERGRDARRGRGRGRGGPLHDHGRRNMPVGHGSEGPRSTRAPITAGTIRELSAQAPTVIVKRVDSQLKEFQQTLGDSAILRSMDAVHNILSSIVRLASDRDSAEQSTASKIIAEILNERSEKFHFNLNIAVKRCTIAQAEDYCKLFQAMLSAFESSAWPCLPIDELHEKVKVLTKAGTINPPLLKRAEELQTTRDQIRDACVDNVSPSEVDGQRDDSQFRLVSILPEWKEINRDDGIPDEVRPNKIDAPYKDWLQYYDIQFRLIREDFIAPLRRGVAVFLHGEKGKKNRDVKIYKEAFVRSYEMTRDRGICFEIEFDASRIHRHNLEHSKKLLFGSLLCFILKKKKYASEAIFGTVTDRDIDQLIRGRIKVQFEGDIIDAMKHCELKTEFIIVESNSYFEAINPILRSLQKAEEAMPFRKHLIDIECDEIMPPVYLRAKETAPTYNLSCLYGKVKRKLKPPLKIDVLDQASWEQANNSEMDTSQLHAIQTALTQEIAVIQGPPGTGKTYIGLKIVEGLLENRHIWDPNRSCPILVMCYTNHALDQFMEGIIDATCKPKVIRVGGRCKNEKVDAYNLNKMRQNAPRGYQYYELSDKFRQLKDEMAMAMCNLSLLWTKLRDYYNRGTLLPLHVIEHVADPYHFYQLSQMAKCAEQQGKQVEVWLGLWNNDSKLQAVKKTQTPLHVPRKRSKETQITDLDDQEENELIKFESAATLAQDERIDEYDMKGYQTIENDMQESEEFLAIQYQEEFSDDGSESDSEEGLGSSRHKHRKSKWLRRSDADICIEEKLFKDSMDEDEAEELTGSDIMSLHEEDRWRLYNYWEEQRYRYLEERNSEDVRMYTQKCQKLQEVKQLQDGHILEKADVIGMTTTGAARYQHILHKIKPKIVIVEEAAEVLEAHIVSNLSAGTQHLILIGDHKQLRPKPNEHILATKYNLAISLFERLVKNNLPRAILEIQHRMRPEIAKLVCPHVYDRLLNHKSVEKYPDVRGISKNLFFMNHSHPESENTNILSPENEFEARYIASLCAHLLSLGYSQKQITILTPYVGQMLKLREYMPREKFDGVQITAIDNFQGEENDIILLSMVRSTNPKRKTTTIGFVKEDNRVCVSLSRAKHGFYVIGNFQLIRHQTMLWESIISDVESRECFGDGIPLYCCNHPEMKCIARDPSDFSIFSPNGGCKKMCDIRLQCGHSCIWKCHITDKRHKKFICRKPCKRSCPFGHPCQSLCSVIICPQCYVQVERVMPKCDHVQVMSCYIKEQHFKCKKVVMKSMPMCGHEQPMPCSAHPKDRKCKAPCTNKCSMGHPCYKFCHEPCGNCFTEVEKTIPMCNHKQLVPCYHEPSRFKCQAPCRRPCPKGHSSCSDVCSEQCEPCKEYVQKVLPLCGHAQTVQCYMEPDPALCIEECEMLCPKDQHLLKKRCNKQWPNCRNEVLQKLPKCGHEVTALCYQKPSDILCKTPCNKSCERGHKCSKFCHEEWAPCLSTVEETLPCGHTHTMYCSQACARTFTCKMKCSKPNCESGHKCKQACHYPNPCKPCEELVSIRMPNCLHEQSLQCFMSSNPKNHGYTCKHACERKLECGHKCCNKCGEKCQRSCTVKVIVGLFCGHHIKVECGKRKEVFGNKCKEEVSVKIGCGHMIKTECSKRSNKGALMKECRQKCAKPLKCGHPCLEVCSKPCTKTCKRHVKTVLPCGHNVELKCHQKKDDALYLCSEKCQQTLPCEHQCTNRCGKPCSSCQLKSTRHYPCGHSSKIPCNSAIEDYPCKKKCRIELHCGHRCSGKCSDCSSLRMHASCIFDVMVSCYCGKSKRLPCAGLTNTCDHKTPKFQCTHGDDYTKCHKKCEWNCKHYKCRRECGVECDRPPCDSRCEANLPCGHQCPGLCGERCMTVCPECDPEKFKKKFFRRRGINTDPPFFELECGHLFTVKYLDEYMEQSQTDVMPKQCPKCHQNMTASGRYGNEVRRAMTMSDVMNQLALMPQVNKEQVHSSYEDVWSFNPQFRGGFGRGSTSSQQSYGARPLYSLLKYSNSIIDTIKEKLHGDEPEESCFLQCVDSYCTLSHSLQSHARREYAIHDIVNHLSNLAIKLVEFTTNNPQLNSQVSKMAVIPERKMEEVHFSSQLLEDFLSELYRSSLHAQCVIERQKALPTTSKKESNIEQLETVERYIESLNPLKDRISSSEYEFYFGVITTAAPDDHLATLHVQTPSVPPVLKGKWRKCGAGHYYCMPPFCGGGRPPDGHRCPECHIHDIS